MLSPSGIYLRKNAQRKYDAITKAACRLFLKNGFSHTSMDAIALAAGVSKQTVYSYFTNKDVLFCQIIEEECERNSPSESVLKNPSLKPDEVLFRIGRGFIDVINSPRCIAFHRLAITEAARYPRIATLFFNSGPLRMHGLLVDWLQRQVADSVFEIENIDVAATYFFAMVRGRYHLSVSLGLKPKPTGKELDDHVHDIVRVFYKVYGATPGTA